MLSDYSSATLLAAAAAALLCLSSFAEATSFCSVGARPTASSDNEGPFYVPNTPVRDRLAPEDILADPANVLVIEGQVFGNDCAPLSNANIEIWYAGLPDNRGNYYSVAGSSLDHRGQLMTDDCGKYRVVQAFPVRFLGSPQVHFRISRSAGETALPLLIAEMYFEESLAAAFLPDPTQVVQTTNEPDGSRSVVFDIQVNEAGSGEIDACGITLTAPPPPPADDTAPSTPNNNSSTPEDDTTSSYSVTVSGNNNCGLAYGPLPVTAMGSSPDTTLALTTLGSTANGEFVVDQTKHTCNAIYPSSPTAWFTVEGSGGLMVASTCWPGTDFDTKLTIFGGPNCTQMECQIANDDATTGSSSSCPMNSLASQASWQSKRFTNYFIMISGFGTKTGNYELSVETLNDKCNYAVPLVATLGPQGVLFGSTINAEVPLAAGGQCPNGGGIVGSYPGLWYSVLGTGNVLEATTCGGRDSDTHTNIHVFESSCNSAASCIGGQYNMNNAPGASTNGCATYQWVSEPLVQYFVLVSTPITRGAFSLQLRDIPLP